DISKLSSNGVQIIKLGNISAKKISYLTPNSEKQVYFTFNNNTNYFTLLYKENSDSQVNQEITQILSTFKFTDNISQNNWVKRPNGDYQTSSNCLWLNTTKANDNGDLTQFVQKFYQTNSLDPLLSQVKYTVKNRETITISAQGVGELFTIYFSKEDKKYSITFNVSSLDNILNTEKCKNYQNDINFVLNNPDLFI
ncbi:MAG: hypothetical protein NTY75_00540, partial [Candidatus Shapirobacteria bacterium]|nr:hypothetical protein [Candidatus Shapirobacteria bacterium]